jgi:hypothetical protein
VLQYVNNNIEMKNAINYSLKFSKKLLVEEFIEGDGIDTIGIMNNGKLFPCGLASRFLVSCLLDFQLMVLYK